jgi:hypothetical protein
MILPQKDGSHVDSDLKNAQGKRTVIYLLATGGGGRWLAKVLQCCCCSL